MVYLETMSIVQTTRILRQMVEWLVNKDMEGHGRTSERIPTQLMDYTPRGTRTIGLLKLYAGKINLP
jgi:hypothetical protein